VPFVFDPNVTDELPAGSRCVEDRRDNPVRGRQTLFRLSQQNMLDYTFHDFVPGFAPPGINRLAFEELVGRPTSNARSEGQHLYGDQFRVTTEQVAKVEGDLFEVIESAILWNAASRWNTHMAGGDWAAVPRYSRPKLKPDAERQIAVLNLPRRFDWVRMLEPGARDAVQAVRTALEEHDLLLPTSTPDILVVVLPEECRSDPIFRTELENLRHDAQSTISTAYRLLEGRIAAGEFLLAIALKKSLRSDRLYQPLYEANVMQLLLEGKLGAPRVDFEVHTLESAGTAARDTYRAVTLAAVATDHAQPHRAIRELHHPTSPDALVRRFLAFLDARMALVGEGQATEAVEQEVFEALDDPRPDA
jgi:hypothetical protein